MIVTYSVIGVILALLFAIGVRKVDAKEAKPINGTVLQATPYQNLFEKYGKKYDVPWQILSAIAFVESSYDPLAVNHADNESIGLMQILCRPDGNGGCANTFNIDGWSRVKRTHLFEEENNVMFGSQILAWNIKNFGVKKGIAVYNAWDQRTKPREGPFKNQAYVDKVLKRAKELGYEVK